MKALINRMQLWMVQLKSEYSNVFVRYLGCLLKIKKKKKDRYEMKYIIIRNILIYISNTYKQCNISKNRKFNLEFFSGLQNIFYGM